MISWNKLEALDQIKEVVDLSKDKPLIIFKHSTRCPISSMAKYRLESDWDFSKDELTSFYINVIEDRPISLEVAEIFDVHHESPQLLLIKDGECVYESSHLDITVKELRESFNYSS